MLPPTASQEKPAKKQTFTDIRAGREKLLGKSSADDDSKEPLQKPPTITLLELQWILGVVVEIEKDLALRHLAQVERKCAQACGCVVDVDINWEFTRTQAFLNTGATAVKVRSLPSHPSPLTRSFL